MQKEIDIVRAHASNKNTKPKLLMMNEDSILRVGIIGTGWIAEKAAITLNGLPTCKAYAVGSRACETSVI